MDSKSAVERETLRKSLSEERAGTTSGENARATTHGKTRTGDRSGDGVQLCRDGTCPRLSVIPTTPSSPGHRAQAEATGLPPLTHIQQNDEPYWRCADPRSDRSRPPPRLPQAQKPTSVTHSLVGNFTHDNELNLIVA